MVSAASVVFMLILYAFSTAIAFLESPVSVTALVGDYALFHCGGTGSIIIWVVDGHTLEHPTIKQRGITAVTISSSSGTVQSNLTVPATSVNNGTTVQCAISASFSSVPTAVSNYSSLTVLSGIGHVNNLNFSPSFDSIMWDPPPTAGVLSLTYHLTVTNTNTGVVIINTTTAMTNYLVIGSLQYCTVYTASVTPFLQGHKGNIEVIAAKTPGGYYKILQGGTDVNYDVFNTVFISFKIDLQLDGLPCPDQRLQFQIHPQSNTSSVIIKYTEVMIHESGSIVYSVTTDINIKHLYTTAISVLGNDGVVQVLELNFSTYHIQDCDVQTDQHTSYILVECTFAINSTAPGFVLIQDEHSQYIVNTTLQRHEDDVSKGSVNITDLPIGEYRVTVYDEMEDYLNNANPAAYTKQNLVQVILPINVYLMSISAATKFIHSSVYTEPVELGKSMDHISPLPSDQSLPPSKYIILASSIASGLLLLMLAVLVLCMVVICAQQKRRQNKGADNTDHIPVDDNVAYMTVQKIYLNNNSAYETILIKQAQL